MGDEKALNAAAERERARKPSGHFGPKNHSAPDATLLLQGVSRDLMEAGAVERNLKALEERASTKRGDYITAAMPPTVLLVEEG